jgi:hypothetical protein
MASEVAPCRYHLVLPHEVVDRMNRRLLFRDEAEMQNTMISCTYIKVKTIPAPRSQVNPTCKKGPALIPSPEHRVPHGTFDAVAQTKVCSDTKISPCSSLTCPTSKFLVRPLSCHALSLDSCVLVLARHPAGMDSWCPTVSWKQSIKLV